MFAAGAASALKAHGNFRQKCKINWQIYARERAKWNWYATIARQYQRGEVKVLLMMMMMMVEELCYEGVASFVCECNFWVDFCQFVPAENVATKYLNMPRVRTTNEMPHTHTLAECAKEREKEREWEGKCTLKATAHISYSESRAIFSGWQMSKSHNDVCLKR